MTFIMKHKEPTKTFMMISNWKKPFGLYSLCKDISALYGLTHTALKVYLTSPDSTPVGLKGGDRFQKQENITEIDKIVGQ